MSEALKGRTAVVTGGASGIGFAISTRLAADGAAVAIFDLDGVAGADAVAALSESGGTALCYAVDVADRSGVDAAVAEVSADLGPPVILVNNAGKDQFRRFVNISVQQWDDTLAVNLTGTFHCCQAIVPAMVDQGWGRIVNISSSAAQGGQEYMAAYVAAKAGVIGLTQAMAKELGAAGITVNTIPPEFIDTPMLRKAEAEGKLGQSVAHHESLTPVRRVGRPEDIAAACAFLVSEEASYITGQIIGVNGGRKT
ncbi:SDR family NAD(P)-dependent oxidoreductase [Candidatus Poriferisocius sp.]|uniref:SDR family NAD(P)-dependent oxidoreductase n=1 Tax=Candidatus Poriferisocius sp. TaxID=3101276 RepID=UPI003B02CEFD